MASMPGPTEATLNLLSARLDEGTETPSMGEGTKTPSMDEGTETPSKCVQNAHS